MDKMAGITVGCSRLGLGSAGNRRKFPVNFPSSGKISRDGFAADCIHRQINKMTSFEVILFIRRGKVLVRSLRFEPSAVGTRQRCRIATTTPEGLRVCLPGVDKSANNPFLAANKSGLCPEGMKETPVSCRSGFGSDMDIAINSQPR